MRISDWSSDVCSSDLAARADLHRYAHIQAIDAIFAVDIGGAGQDALLVAQIGFGHSDDARGRSVEGRTGAAQRDDPAAAAAGDRKGVVEGKSVSVRVDIGGIGNLKKKKQMTPS